MKRILKREDYLKYKKSINEAAFANDANWGDTLIGRLVNSLARKSKISFNQSKMTSLVKKLKEYFDILLEVGKIDVSDVTQIHFLEISNLLGVLKKQVENEEDVDLLIETTENLISKVSIREFDNKELMLESLNEFLEFLKNLSSENVVDSDNNNNNNNNDNTEEVIYKETKILLQSLVDIGSMIEKNVVRFNDKKVQKNIPTNFNENEYKRLKLLFKTKKNIDVLKNLVELCKKAISIYTDSNNKERLSFYKNELLLNNKQFSTFNSSKPKEDYSITSKKDVLVPESKLFEGEANLEENELDAKRTWLRVVKAYKDSNLSIYLSKIEKMLSISIKDGKDEFFKTKKNIISLGKQVVSNKKTVGAEIKLEDVLKESLSINDFSKSISLFLRVVLVFNEDSGILGAFGSAKTPMLGIINSFNNLEKSFKNNENIFLYNKFILIKERNEFSSSIKSKFDEIFSDKISYFEISDERKQEIESSISEVDGDKFIFDAEDQVIEIVRAFNRAWRIHTPGVIPSGRSSGKVSNKVFREYEYVGDGNSGTPNEPGGGPYRNIELWETWNNGVLDVLSDTKYRSIFSDNAIFKFKQGGDDIKKGGKILLNFINSLLNDNKMYRSGAMPKFISEYFDIPEKFLDDKVLDSRPGDSKKNAIVSKQISSVELDMKPISKIAELRDSLELTLKDNKNIALKFTAKSNDEEKDYYGVFTEKLGEDYIMILTNNNFPFDLSKISIYGERAEGISPEFIKFRFTSSNSIKGKAISFDDYQDIGRSKAVEWSFNNIEVLCLKEENLPYLEERKTSSKLKDKLSIQRYDKIKTQL